MEGPIELYFAIVLAVAIFLIVELGSLVRKNLRKRKHPDT